MSDSFERNTHYLRKRFTFFISENNQQTHTGGGGHSHYPYRLSIPPC
ncbi:hypothetical protein [Polynucleobacter sp. 31A-FELB]|nr:hypothetical protein [Polynucleobacter sp. 31A-FELB]